MKYIIFCLLLTSCANCPTGYYQLVEITSGPYIGKRGMLIGDCSGFENYKVRLSRGLKVCVRSWNMERI